MLQSVKIYKNVFNLFRRAHGGYMITFLACLTVFARCPSENIIKEKLVKLMTISENTKGEDIMNELKREFIRLSINFGNIVSVIIDRAPSMIGKIIEILKLLKQDQNLVEFHCIIQQEALCVKFKF